MTVAIAGMKNGRIAEKYNGDDALNTMPPPTTAPATRLRPANSGDERRNRKNVVSPATQRSISHQLILRTMVRYRATSFGAITAGDRNVRASFDESMRAVRFSSFCESAADKRASAAVRKKPCGFGRTFAATN